MGKTKHEKTYVNYDKAYETNVVGMSGILYFGIGLLLLIVITFGLMWFFLGVLENDYAERDLRNENPLALSKDEALPPEPRLQSAPGFGVGSGADRINLELREPQAEYRVLHEQWEKQWKDGQKDEKTGTVISLPIKQAEEKLLQQRVGGDNKGSEETLKESRTMVSASSAGRVSSDTRR